MCSWDARPVWADGECMQPGIYMEAVCVLWGCTFEFGVLNPFPPTSRCRWSAWLRFLMPPMPERTKQAGHRMKTCWHAFRTQKQGRIKAFSLNSPTVLLNFEVSSGHGSVEGTETCWWLWEPQFAPPPHHHQLRVHMRLYVSNASFPSSLCRPPKTRRRHQCFPTPRARGTAPASAMSPAPRWALQQSSFGSKARPSVRITSGPIMAATTAKAAASTLPSSTVSTAVPFPPTGSGNGDNITYRTTLTTVTVTTNETSINATAFPDPMMESSGMGMVLIPFGIITVLGLAVAIVREYLQIIITNLGLSRAESQISEGKWSMFVCH